MKEAINQSNGKESFAHRLGTTIGTLSFYGQALKELFVTSQFNILTARKPRVRSRKKEGAAFKLNPDGSASQITDIIIPGIGVATHFISSKKMVKKAEEEAKKRNDGSTAESILTEWTRNLIS